VPTVQDGGQKSEVPIAFP